MNMTCTFGSLDLPNPDWNDSKAAVRSLMTGRSMTGHVYTYMRKPENSILRLSFTCSNINRYRIPEIRNWLINSLGQEITLTDANSETWTGYLVDVEHILDVLRRGTYRGEEEKLRTEYEGISITFEFEGYQNA